MNQGKVEVVKEEMTRVNIDILGIGELKQTGIGEFNAILGCNLRNERMISVHFQGKPFNITVIQVYAPTTMVEEAEVERFYDDLQNLLKLTYKKDVLFIIGEVQCKCRK